MSLSVGIVGLPNVGKSTLFKLLTKKEVDISNYPFCTIEPNVGIVSVPDERLQKLAELFRSKKVVPAVIKFVDIAGLVRGANKGEGLGNQFLSRIREVDAIVHVARLFEAPDIIHTESVIDPIRDIDVVNTELILKDMDTVEKRISGLEKDIKSGSKEAITEREILTEIKEAFDRGEFVVRYLENNKDKLKHKNVLPFIRQLQLLTAKPVIYVLNSGSSEKISESLLRQITKKNLDYLIINIKEELDVLELSEMEKRELEIESNLSKLIEKAYNVLGLITFFTAGQDETRGWTIRRGTKAPRAAGTIHSDFEKKFIKAEVIECDKLIEAGGFSQSASKGLLRIEGKDYVVQDGDVITVKHG